MEFCKDKINSLEDEIKTNLGLSKGQFKDYVRFKAEFNKNVIPTLDRINNNYMGNKIVQTNYIKETSDNTHVFGGNSQQETNPGVGEGLINENDTHSTGFRGNTTESQHEINCDVLFLTDSNLHKMNADIMNHGTDAQNIFCPLLIDFELIYSKETFKNLCLMWYKRYRNYNVQYGRNEYSYK